MLLPYVTAGRAGEVAMGWYQANASADDPEASWYFVVAQSRDGERFETSVLTPDPVHKGAMCKAVTCLGDNRYAGDFLGLAFGPEGSLHAAWIAQTGTKLLPAGQSPTPYTEVRYARTQG